MTKIQSETEIAAPREDVFDLLLDPKRLDDWVTASHGVSDVPDGPLKKGSSFRQALRVGGAPFHVRWNVVELDRPSRVVWKGKGPAGTSAKVVYELAPNGSGTVFTYRNEYGLPGGILGTAAGGIGAGTAKRVMKHSLANLKRLLESGGRK